MARRLLVSLITLAALVAFPVPGSAGGSAPLSKIQHIVVIYEENHSFDDLYGGWEGVNGLGNADAAHTTQVGQGGAPYTCLLQGDVNLTSPPLTATCTDSTTATTFTSHFANAPFQIDTYIPASATTCPDAAHAFSFPNGVANGSGQPGGCTRDLVHRFYQEQYQLNGGNQNRYVTGSDAAGLSMGYYDTHALPVYAYLHGAGHPRYAILDDLFQAAFGGSFLNHQWLIAAGTPTYPGAAETLHSILDANGMPVLRSPPSSQSSVALYTSPATTVRDAALTSACPAPLRLACGDYAVNTMQQPGLPVLPEQGVPVPPSALRLLRALRGGRAGPEPPPRRAGVPPAGEVVEERVQPRAGQLREAAGPRERAPRLRERAERELPPGHPAQGHRGEQVREGHDGGGHLRRVRGAVGPRLAPRATSGGQAPGSPRSCSRRF